MSEIPFRYYILPDGLQKDISILRPVHISQKAGVIIEAGHRFEIEILTTGECSLTIHHIEEEVDVAIEICANGPEVPITVDKLITEFEIPSQT